MRMGTTFRLADILYRAITHPRAERLCAPPAWLVWSLLGIAVVISGVAVSFHGTRRELAAGVGDVVLREFVNNVIGILIFGSLVAAAVVLRRDSESHKRLLLLATISVVGAAWSRFDQFFPAFENYWVFLIIADSPLLVAIARDLMAYKRVHPVYIWVGGLSVAYDVINHWPSRVRLGYASHGGCLAKPRSNTKWFQRTGLRPAVEPRR